MMPSNAKTPAMTKSYLDHLQGHAGALRAELNLGPDEPLDPFALAEHLGAIVRWTDDSQAFDVQTFSGMAKQLPDGRLLVLLNHRQPHERVPATLMEELCHWHYQHPLTQVDAQGRAKYDAVIEQEAKQTGAAALLPARAVAMAVFKQEPPESLAASYRVSVELVEMRIKVLGLWSKSAKRVKRDAA